MEKDVLSQLPGLLETRQWNSLWASFLELRNMGIASAYLFLMGSHAAFNRRDLFSARHLAESALSTWVPTDSTKLLGQIRFHLGMVARELGDTAIALEQFQAFLSDLPIHHPELSMGEGKAYFYLALTHRQRRNPQEAISCYRRAIDCFERDGLPGLVCKALQNLAWLYCQLGQPFEARSCLDQAARLVESSEDQIHQDLGEAYYAAITGQFLDAAQMCERIFRRVQRGESITFEEQAQATWIAGTVALSQGNLQLAKGLADMALTYAIEAKDSRLMNDAASLRRRIQLHRQEGA